MEKCFHNKRIRVRFVVPADSVFAAQTPPGGSDVSDDQMYTNAPFLYIFRTHL